MKEQKLKINPQRNKTSICTKQGTKWRFVPSKEQISDFTLARRNALPLLRKQPWKGGFQPPRHSDILHATRSALLLVCQPIHRHLLLQPVNE